MQYAKVWNMASLVHLRYLVNLYACRWQNFLEEIQIINRQIYRRTTGDQKRSTELSIRLSK